MLKKKREQMMGKPFFAPDYNALNDYSLFQIRDQMMMMHPMYAAIMNMRKNFGISTTGFSSTTLNDESVPDIFNGFESAIFPSPNIGFSVKSFNLTVPVEFMVKPSDFNLLMGELYIGVSTLTPADASGITDPTSYGANSVLMQNSPNNYFGHKLHVKLEPYFLQFNVDLLYIKVETTGDVFFGKDKENAVKVGNLVGQLGLIVLWQGTNGKIDLVPIIQGIPPIITPKTLPGINGDKTNEVHFDSSGIVGYLKRTTSVDTLPFEGMFEAQGFITGNLYFGFVNDLQNTTVQNPEPELLKGIFMSNNLFFQFGDVSKVYNANVNLEVNSNKVYIYVGIDKKVYFGKDKSNAMFAGQYQLNQPVNFCIITNGTGSIKVVDTVQGIPVNNYPDLLPGERDSYITQPNQIDYVVSSTLGLESKLPIEFMVTGVSTGVSETYFGFSNEPKNMTMGTIFSELNTGVYIKNSQNFVFGFDVFSENVQAMNYVFNKNSIYVYITAQRQIFIGIDKSNAIPIATLSGTPLGLTIISKGDAVTFSFVDIIQGIPNQFLDILPNGSDQQSFTTTDPTKYYARSFQNVPMPFEGMIEASSTTPVECFYFGFSESVLSSTDVGFPNINDSVLIKNRVNEYHFCKDIWNKGNPYINQINSNQLYFSVDLLGNVTFGKDKSNAMKAGKINGTANLVVILKNAGTIALRMVPIVQGTPPVSNQYLKILPNPQGTEFMDIDPSVVPGKYIVRHFDLASVQLPMEFMLRIQTTDIANTEIRFGFTVDGNPQNQTVDNLLNYSLNNITIRSNQTNVFGNTYNYVSNVWYFSNYDTNAIYVMFDGNKGLYMGKTKEEAIYYGQWFQPNFSLLLIVKGQTMVNLQMIDVIQGPVSLYPKYLPGNQTFYNFGLDANYYNVKCGPALPTTTEFMVNASNIDLTKDFYFGITKNGRIVTELNPVFDLSNGVYIKNSSSYGFGNLAFFEGQVYTTQINANSMYVSVNNGDISFGKNKESAIFIGNLPGELKVGVIENSQGNLNMNALVTGASSPFPKVLPGNQTFVNISSVDSGGLYVVRSKMNVTVPIEFNLMASGFNYSSSTIYFGFTTFPDNVTLQNLSEINTHLNNGIFIKNSTTNAFGASKFVFGIESAEIINDNKLYFKCDAAGNVLIGPNPQNTHSIGNIYSGIIASGPIGIMIIVSGSGLFEMVDLNGDDPLNSNLVISDVTDVIEFHKESQILTYGPTVFAGKLTALPFSAVWRSIMYFGALSTMEPVAEQQLSTYNLNNQNASIDLFNGQYNIGFGGSFVTNNAPFNNFYIRLRIHLNGSVYIGGNATMMPELLNKQQYSMPINQTNFYQLGTSRSSLTFEPIDETVYPVNFDETPNDLNSINYNSGASVVYFKKAAFIANLGTGLKFGGTINFTQTNSPSVSYFILGIETKQPMEYVNPQLPTMSLHFDRTDTNSWIAQHSQHSFSNVLNITGQMSFVFEIKNDGSVWISWLPGTTMPTLLNKKYTGSNSPNDPYYYQLGTRNANVNFTPFDLTNVNLYYDDVTSMTDFYSNDANTITFHQYSILNYPIKISGRLLWTPEIGGNFTVIMYVGEFPYVPPGTTPWATFTFNNQNLVVNITNAYTDIKVFNPLAQSYSTMTTQLVSSGSVYFSLQVNADKKIYIAFGNSTHPTTLTKVGEFPTLPINPMYQFGIRNCALQFLPADTTNVNWTLVDPSFGTITTVDGINSIYNLTRNSESYLYTTIIPPIDFRPLVPIRIGFKLIFTQIGTPSTYGISAIKLAFGAPNPGESTTPHGFGIYSFRLEMGTINYTFKQNDQNAAVVGTVNTGISGNAGIPIYCVMEYKTNFNVYVGFSTVEMPINLQKLSTYAVNYNYLYFSIEHGKGTMDLTLYDISSNVFTYTG